MKAAFLNGMITLLWIYDLIVAIANYYNDPWWWRLAEGACAVIWILYVLFKYFISWKKEKRDDYENS